MITASNCPFASAIAEPPKTSPNVRLQQNLLTSQNSSIEKAAGFIRLVGVSAGIHPRGHGLRERNMEQKRSSDNTSDLEVSTRCQRRQQTPNAGRTLPDRRLRPQTESAARIDWRNRRPASAWKALARVTAAAALGLPTLGAVLLLRADKAQATTVLTDDSGPLDALRKPLQQLIERLGILDLDSHAFSSPSSETGDADTIVPSRQSTTSPAREQRPPIIRQRPSATRLDCRGGSRTALPHMQFRQDNEWPSIELIDLLCDEGGSRTTPTISLTVCPSIRFDHHHPYGILRRGLHEGY